MTASLFPPSSRYRLMRDKFFTLFCYTSLLLSTISLGSILVTLILRGWKGLDIHLFTMSTPAPEMLGGLLNAIIGSLMMSFIAIIAAIPFGILVATFLTEFSGKKRALFPKVIRFVNDILLGSPSIIVGLFVYALVVTSASSRSHYSGWAGTLALFIIAVPIMVRGSEDVMYLVSPMLKESALALGIPRWRVVISIVYRSAAQGLLTTAILAFARISGETAPLLFTALNNSFMSWNLNEPIASLPVVIYNFAMSPYVNWQNLAWSGALLITTFILIMNIIARWIIRKR